MTLCTVTLQVPLPKEFSRQKYYAGLPSPPPGDLPNLGIETGAPALQADALLPEPPGNPLVEFKVRTNWKKQQQTIPKS